MEQRGEYAVIRNNCDTSIVCSCLPDSYSMWAFSIGFLEYVLFATIHETTLLFDVNIAGVYGDRS